MCWTHFRILVFEYKNIFFLKQKIYDILDQLLDEVRETRKCVNELRELVQNRLQETHPHEGLSDELLAYGRQMLSQGMQYNYSFIYNTLNYSL